MTFLADTADNVGSFLHLPELGISELWNGGQQTANTLTPEGVNLVNSPAGWGLGTTSAYTQALSSPINTPTNSPVGDAAIQYDQFGNIIGNTGTTATRVAPDLSSYDQAIGTYNNSLGRLPGQLGIAQGNINQSYGGSLRGINTTRDNANTSYNQSTTQNGQALRTNKNQIADQQSNGLRGLMRLLGSYGASGSEAALNAGQATSQQASQQRSGAGQTYAGNQANLDTNWGTFNTQDKQNRDNLESWKTNQMNSAQSQSDSTKQDLLTKLAGLQGQRAQAAGGSYTASAQPYIDQAQGLNASIDNLGRLAPTYTGAAAQYATPTLASYQNQGVNGAKVNQGPAGGDNPYLAMLLGLDKTKQNLG